MQKLTILASALVLLFGLNGCGADSAELKPLPNTFVNEINPSDGDGNKTGDVFLRFEIPEEPPAHVAAAQETENLTYIRVDIDNRDGADPIGIASILIADEDEKTYAYVPLQMPEEYSDVQIEASEVGTLWLASQDGLPEAATEMEIEPWSTRDVGFYVTDPVVLNTGG